jgi:hypothetical protein
MLKIVLIALTAGAVSATASIAILQLGDAGSNVDIWTWFVAPVSGAANHYIAPTVAWHGRLMVLAWAVFLPPAIVVPRFFKVTPGQDWPREVGNPFWFVTHRQLGYWIAIISTVGVALMLWAKDGWGPLGSTHASIGWVLFFLCWLQMFNALLRGTHGGPINPFTREPVPPSQWHGDHFSMTRRRVIFEIIHKALGYVLVLVAAIAIISGLRQADAARWMWIAIAAWTGVWIALFIKFQRDGRCLDTYQAIWGLDETLAGNRRNPVGWGINRVDPTSEYDANNVSNGSI